MNSSNQSNFTPDDPRITAFALGELEGTEQALVAAAVAADPDLQRIVDEIRNTVDDLTAALASEPLPETEQPILPQPYQAARQVVRFPYWLAAGSVVAASLTFMVVINKRTVEKDADPMAGRVVFDVSATPYTPRAEAGDRGYTNNGRFIETAIAPDSTFPLQIGVQNFAEVQQSIRDGTRPDPGTVKIEELLNHFDFEFSGEPENPEAAFAASMEVAVAPWAPANRLVLIGIKGRSNSEDDSSKLIARDVSVSIHFDPLQVLSYRLIGFESPSRPAPGILHQPPEAVDFFVGNAVTALYEIVPTLPGAATNDLPQAPSAKPRDLVIATLHYDQTDGPRNQEFSFYGHVDDRDFSTASADFKFAASVAGFGMVLNESPYIGDATLSDIASWARQGIGIDPKGQREEFLELVFQADRLIN